MVDDCLILLTADNPVVFVRLASSHGHGSRLMDDSLQGATWQRLNSNC